MTCSKSLLLLCFLGAAACAAPAPKVNDGQTYFAQVRQLAETYEALERFSGVLAIAVAGQPTLMESYGYADRENGLPNSTTTQFALASLTKQITAAAVLKLEADGRLRVEDTIGRHLSGYPLPAANQVTIHHLLTHTSGIPSLWRFGDGLEEVNASAEPVTLERLLGFFQDRDLLFSPGERFRYSNSGYVLLAAIIEAASDLSYPEYLDEALFQPLGMNDTGCGPGAQQAVPYHGAPNIRRASTEHWSWSVGDGCVHSTVGDLLLWASALRSDRLLPAEQRHKLFAPHVEAGPERAYGYGWFLSSLHGRAVAHHNGAGEGTVAEMSLFTDDGPSFVALANYAPELGTNAPGRIIADAATLYFDQAFEPPPRVVRLSSAQKNRWIGRFTIDGAATFDVTEHRDQLWIEAIERPTIFDVGVLASPEVLDRAPERALQLLTSAQSGNYEEIELCEDLRAELSMTELSAEWDEMLGSGEALIEMKPAQLSRYPGEATLIIVTRLQLESRAVYVALDMTPELQVCGWYAMGSKEFELRRNIEGARRVRLAPLSRDELLVDGFNYRETEVRLVAVRAADGPIREMKLLGKFEHSARRTNDRAPDG